jgi:hypothetical protein
MARSKEQIQNSLRTSIINTDNRLDLKVGPLWDYLIAPIPPELATIESQIETLKVYYSPSFATVATVQEARDFAVNFGTGPSIGNFAKTSVVFYRNSAPAAGLTYTVPIGSLVQTIDGNLVYRTLQDITMSGDYAATYFNPSTQRYEIYVTVEAVAPGVKYNIPANHIKRMQPAVSGFDGIVQVSDAAGGTEPEDSYDVAARVQSKFKGLERNSISGIMTMIKQTEPNYVTAVSVIKPTDRVEFRRLTSGPALDVCVQGTNYIVFSEDYLASGGELVVPITTNRTVVSITSVMVNGNYLDSAYWTFIPDATLEYQLSTRANPVVQLTAALTTNDLIEIVGTRNDLLNEMQALFTGDNAIFYTDILLRAFIDLPIVVSLEARITSGDPDEIRGQIMNYLTAYIQPTVGGIPTILIPERVRSLLRENIPEVDTVKILEFRRKLGSIDAVEIISPYKNQAPIFDTVAASITVRL